MCVFVCLIDCVVTTATRRQAEQSFVLRKEVSDLLCIISHVVKVCLFVQRWLPNI